MPAHPPFARGPQPRLDLARLYDVSPCGPVPQACALYRGILASVASVDDMMVEIDGRNISGRYKVTLDNGETVKGNF